LYWLGVKNAYTLFRVLQWKGVVGRPIELTVQNRFNFTNLNETRIAWQLNGRAMGSVTASIEPHATGVVTIPAAGYNVGDRIGIIVTDEPRVPMTGPWSLHANALGTNDFRSTKAHVHEASLTARDGRTWQVISPDTRQAVRAWVDGDRIRVLVAAFNTGGYDQFFATHYAAERRPLTKGAAIASAFRVVMRRTGG
jgi:hypothetical protein